MSDSKQEIEKAMKGRHYNTSILPIINKEKAIEDEFGALKEIYSEVNANYRHLSDVRFRLLGFVPAVAVIAWAELLDKVPVTNLENIIIGIIIGSLGFIITHGIRVYDKRNDKLYDDLISRGRKIEDTLGVHTGIFKGRINKYEKDKMGKDISHYRGIRLIYTSVFIGWGLMIFRYVFYLILLGVNHF